MAAEAENRANPAPRRIALRMDAGFGAAEHLAWLGEPGYSVLAKAHAPQIAQALRQEKDLRWEKIRKNGFIAQSQRTQFGDCPSPVRLFACKQGWGDDRPEHWATLIATPGLTPADWPARRVGVFSNGRQAMQAGIKQSKGIFASCHLPTRHQAGVALYQELVLFAQTFFAGSTDRSQVPPSRPQPASRSWYRSARTAARSSPKATTR